MWGPGGLQSGGRRSGRRGGAKLRGEWRRELVVIGVLAAGILFSPLPARADPIVAFGGRFGSLGNPPLVLARLRPAVPVPPRILSLRLVHERYRHPEWAQVAEDPAIASLADARVAITRLDMGYGLGGGLTTRIKIGWASFAGPAGGGNLGASPTLRGFEDLDVALDFSPPVVLERLRGRLEGGLTLATGSEQAWQSAGTGSAPQLLPLTVGKTRGFIGAGLTVRLSRREAPVALHFHAEGTVTGRGTALPGTAFIPFRGRLPLVSLGESPFDERNLRFAFSLTATRVALFAELDLPVVSGAGAVIHGKEMPRTLSPGLALRFRGIEIGAQLDVPFASDEAATAFDPRQAYPDWAVRIRVGTDLVPRDRDRDRDRVGDLSDRCPDVPEDPDGFADDDGCPDPDNDGDQIPDAVDACPDEPEDRDGFADGDGCPDTDNDRDGIPDALDLCPDSPEDADGVEDEDGCPEWEGAGTATDAENSAPAGGR